MPILLESDIKQQNRSFYLKRLIECPGHYLIPPTVDIYKREPVPWLKECSDWVEIKGKRVDIKKKRIVKDGLGRKVIDWKKLIELKKKGVILHPKVTAAWAIEHVYDPMGALCNACDKRCREGLGTINERSIKRLIGKPIKNGYNC